MLSHLLSCLLPAGAALGGQPALGQRSSDVFSLTIDHSSLLPVLSLGRWVGLGALHESVLDLSTEVAQGAHAAGALTCSPLGLERPIIASNLARGVTSRGASLLLLVPVLFAAIATQRVRLVAAFSLSLSSLRLYT